MKPIQSPLRPADTGEGVTDLQDAMFVLIEKNIWKLPSPDPSFVTPRLLAIVAQERSIQTYSDGTAMLVRLFRNQYKKQFHLSPGEDVDEPTANALNALLKKLGALDNPPQKWKVSGRVTNLNKKGLAEYKIVLSEFDLDGMTEINCSVSNADGSFNFEFDFTYLLRQGDETTAPDLIFQVFDATGAERTVMSVFTIESGQETAVPRLAESEQSPIVLINVPPNLTLRIVPDLSQRPLTEFEQLVTQLTPFMRRASFANLKEDDKNFQISFLSKESGVDKTKIEQLRDAFEQERQSQNIPAWVFFGLASGNVALASTLPMKLQDVTAILSPLQPSTDEQDLEPIAEALQKYAKEKDIGVQVTNLMTSVGTILQPILGSGEKLNSILDAYARYEGDIENFWQDISRNPELESEVPKIQLTLQLSQLTLNNSGLVTALQERGIQNTRQLVDISPQDWEALALASKAEMPAHITGETDEDRAKAYAGELQTLVEAAFPTEVIKKTIQDPDIQVFLNHNPEFDFTVTPVETYINDQGEKVFDGAKDTEALKTQLRQMQRIYTVTENAADMKVLMEQQYGSAHQISKLSLQDFTQSLAGAIPEETAYRYHLKARAVSDATVAVYHIINDQVRWRAVARTPWNGKVPTDDLMKPIIQSIPNWETLFGSLDMCECQHCKSVYGPAAYFVDLLNILLGQKKGAARLELFRRRPDLKYTKLSCEHTETLMPYIDLVNEVLATYVANMHVGDSDADSHAKDSTNDTSNFTAEDLAANPQQPNPKAAQDTTDAYDALQAATYPLSLPFDMYLETGRQFLQEQQSSRFEVMSNFGNPTSHAAAAERLNISEGEFNILSLKNLDGTSDAGIDPIKDLWGISTISLGTVLMYVQTFLDTTKIAYTDLISLLKTRFLNPNFPVNDFLQDLSEADRTAWLAANPAENDLALLVIELEADGDNQCDLSQTKLVHLNGTPLSDDELSRFNRFIRLWKKLGCTPSELDGLLNALGALDLTPQAIDDLSGLWYVAQAMNLSLEQTAVLAGNIPTAGKDALFARLFLNKAILLIDDKFSLNTLQTELDNTSEFLDQHVPAILAALRITEEELNLIADYTSLSLASDTLTLANLSKIYRYAVFAKALRISISDLITWFKIVPVSPWTTVPALLDTQALFMKLANYGFKAADFAYLFKDEKRPGTSLPPTPDIINQSAKTLREGLLKISQEYVPKDGQVTADFLKKVLGIVLAGDEASKIIGILDGSNTVNLFSYLLTPVTANDYKNILDSYLTAADVADLVATLDISERFKKYWMKIEAKLLPVLRTTYIQQHLIATFKMEAALVSLLLEDASVLQVCLDMETDTPAHAQAYTEIYIQVFKLMWLAGELKLSATELRYFQNNAQFASFSWKSFNFAAWIRVADYVALRNALPTAERDLIFIFETAKAGGDVAGAIIEVTSWNPADVKFFVSLRAITDFFNEAVLVVLQKQIEVSQRIGVSIEKLQTWASDTLNKEQAQDIKRTLKAKYDETAWIEVSTQIYNRLRSRLRDSLEAFLLQKSEIKGLGLKNTNDLYGYFLIDIEMDSCMLTSRIVQAVASVQLFVQRCLLNLEAPQIAPNQIDANQWTWMKNYRVWEANRKVFLYPENWIEPELRDNKTPFFKELESTLLQGEVTNDSVETALMDYLEKLHNVARLEICGIYEDTEAKELHVFGRTFNTPPQYFYRKLDLTTEVWTPWEIVQVDIQSNEQGDSAGVHLIPVVWNRRVYLFWPIFTEKSDREKIQQDKDAHNEWQKKHDQWVTDINNLEQEKKDLAAKGQGNTKSEANYGPEPIEPPINPWAYWEVHLAWSEYRQNKWTNKKVSQSFIKTPSSSDGVAGNYIYRFSLTLGTPLTIKLFYDKNMSSFKVETHMLIPNGEFQLNCNGRVAAFSYEETGNRTEVIRPEQTNFYQAYLSAIYSGDSILWHLKDSIPLVLLGNGITKDILSGSVKEYNILFPADHDFSNNFLSRFIYQDHERTYYVEPVGSSFVAKDGRGTLRDASKVTFNIPVRTETVRLLETPVEKAGAAIMGDGEFKLFQPTMTKQLADSGQIGASTAMQLQAAQRLSPESFPIEKKVAVSRAASVGAKYYPVPAAQLLRFKPFFHAYICKFMEALDKEGIDGILNLKNQQYTDLPPPFFNLAGPLNFYGIYGPSKNVDVPWPLEEIDFSPSGAYSLYNWELFFHVPMLIATRLKANQRFDEAMRWYHFVFNPTTNENLPSADRYWQIIPFRNTPIETLDSLLRQLQLPANDPKRKELEDEIAAWRVSPFNPHLIARMRLGAYQKNVVMKYFDNLIAWGDGLFAQDTFESINEATQLYILAAELLGERPEKIPERGSIQILNYAELEASPLGLDAFSNTYVMLETTFPWFNSQPVSAGEAAAASILNTTASTLYFCLPDNDILLGYWDTIADRLFKIRHCQNIEGIERQLPLFQPPIDPALLVRAVAGGVDISSVLADLNSPLPNYRFVYILQKALEICAELRSLGNSLLSALEKKDAEALSMMRSEYDTQLLELTRMIKQFQITEAQRTREGLEKTREVTEYRGNYYSQLLEGGLSSSEKENQTLSLLSLGLSEAGQLLEMAASLAEVIPDQYTGLLAAPMGGGIGLLHTGGGTKGGAAMSAVGRFFHMASTMTTYAASNAQTNAVYERRAAEWKLQQDLATKELAQIDKQILAAQIREQIADQDLSNHEQQIDNARQVEDFYRNKYTNQELYGWMIGDISTSYFQCYQLTYDLAKKAEKTYRYELGLPTSNFVQFGIWDSFRKGLMSGERLYLCLKQMEKSYMDQNRREYEISKHVSLLQYNSLALIALKETGTCTIDIPETLFDADYPGHYMRRIKSISLTIPCIVGPYTNVNCTLTLLSSMTRISNASPSTYSKDLEQENSRVINNFAATESIATSSAQNDSGLFELNFRDERYLPFEGSGVISRWRIEFPKDFSTFDRDTISDVVLHIKYTAREGGTALRDAAVENLKAVLKDEASKPQSRLFSLRHEFPTEWQRLQSAAAADGSHNEIFSLSKDRFPFIFQGETITTSDVELFGIPKDRAKGSPPPDLKLTLSGPSGAPLSLKAAPAVGLAIHKTAEAVFEVKNMGISKNEADWTIQVEKADVEMTLERQEDILMVCHYSVST